MLSLIKDDIHTWMIWDISCRLNWPHMYAEDVKKSVMKRMKWWGYPNCQPCPLQRRLFTNRSNQNVIYCFMLGWLLTHSLAASVKEYTCASFCDSVQHQNLCVASCWPPHSRSTLKNIPSPRLWLIWHIAYTPIILCYSTWCCWVLRSKHEYLVRSFFVTNGFPTAVDPYKKWHLVRRNNAILDLLSRGVLYANITYTYHHNKILLFGPGLSLQGMLTDR